MYPGKICVYPIQYPVDIVGRQRKGWGQQQSGQQSYLRMGQCLNRLLKFSET